MIKIRISAPVYPTENRERVVAAMQKVLTLGDGDLQDDPRQETIMVEGDPAVTYEIDVVYLVLETDDTHCLRRLQHIITKEQIEATAKKVLFASLRRDRISFNINKQAALAGAMHFAEEGESPLGPIRVEIETDDPEGFVEWFFSPSEEEE
jgi:predicted RNA binding protein with dsRBD fold (UPF0201 family)